MIWGGGWAKAGKKTQRLLAQEKKTQLNNQEKVQRLVAEEKKTEHEFSARGPPRSLMVRPLVPK